MMNKDDIKKANIARLDTFGSVVYHHMSERDAQMLTAILVLYLAGEGAWFDWEQHECVMCGQPGTGGATVAHLPNCPIRWLIEHKDSLHRLRALVPWPDIRAPG